MYAVGGGLVLVAAVVLGLYSLYRPAGVSSTKWEQITDFPDSAVQPALSPDGHILAFIRGPETFVTPGQVYLKFLPDGQPIQLTHDDRAMLGPVFSADGSRVAYTGLENLNWDTYEIPVTGGEAKLLLPNASGLTWLDDQRVLFSEIKTGIHMGLVTAQETRGEERNVYFPAEAEGMAHRSYASPDRKSVVAVEMSASGWQRCRLLPLDGSSPGNPIGPEGRCTSAAWSPDGKWIYLTSDAGGAGFHVWRMRYPDGPAERLTAGPTEEAGIAIAPDGKSLITSVGTAQGTVWFHDEKGDRQVSSEGYAFYPQLSRDGAALYYLQENRGSFVAPGSLKGPREQEETKLIRVDLRTGTSEEIVSGTSVTDFSVSADGKQVIYAAQGRDGRSHLWLVSVDRRLPPKQVAAATDDDVPFLLDNGDIVFCRLENGGHYVYRIKPDGREPRKLLPNPVVALSGVSPDGKYLTAWTSLSNQDSGGAVMAYRLSDGAATRICDFCWADWSPDGKDFYISFDIVARSNSMRRGHTYVFSLKSESELPALPSGGLRSEADIAKLATVVQGANRLDYFAPGPSPAIYAFARRTIQRNLYRVPLP